MFFEPFNGIISLRSKVCCSPNWPSVLTRATSYRFCICFAAVSKHCLWQGMGKGLFQEWSFCENNSMKNDSVEKLFWWSLLQIGEIKWMFVRIDACISEQPNSHFISDVAYDSITKISSCIDENSYFAWRLERSASFRCAHSSVRQPNSYLTSFERSASFVVLIRSYDTNCLKIITLYFCRAQEPVFLYRNIIRYYAPGLW